MIDMVKKRELNPRWLQKQLFNKRQMNPRWLQRQLFAKRKLNGIRMHNRLLEKMKIQLGKRANRTILDLVLTLLGKQKRSTNTNTLQEDERFVKIRLPQKPFQFHVIQIKSV